FALCAKSHPRPRRVAVSDRRCLVCGASLEARRRHARTRSPSCRREMSRLRAVLSGRGDGPYATRGDVGVSRRNRENAPRRALQGTLELDGRLPGASSHANRCSHGPRADRKISGTALTPLPKGASGLPLLSLSPNTPGLRRATDRAVPGRLLPPLLQAQSEGG